MCIPFTLLFFAVLMPGPSSPAAQEFPSKPPGRQESTADAPIKQRPPATEKPSWTLDRLVKEAVTGNPETLNKRAGLAAAEASVDTAFQQFFPTPYGQVQQGYEQDRNQSTDSSERVGIVGIRQPIWTGGKLTADLNAAEASAMSADYSIAETQLSLGLRVVAAYQNLMLYRGRTKAQIEGIDLLEQYAAMMARRVQSSVSASVEQSLVNSRLTQARSDLSIFRTGEQTALAQMAQLVGQPLKADEIEIDSAQALSAPPEPDEVLRQALQTNPTLHRLDADIKTVEHQEEKQRATLMPTLSVKAEYQNGFFDQDNGTGEDTRVYATLDFSPGAGLSSLANIRGATARVTGTKQAQAAARRELTTKIHADYEDCQNAYTRQQLIGRTIKSSRDVLESYTRLFVAGKRSWLDVLNSARELTQNELVMADTLASYRAASYRLRLLAGEPTWLREDHRLPESISPQSLKVAKAAPAQVDQTGATVKAAKTEPARVKGTQPMKEQCIGVGCPAPDTSLPKIEEPSASEDAKIELAQVDQTGASVEVAMTGSTRVKGTQPMKEQCIGVGCSAPGMK